MTDLINHPGPSEELKKVLLSIGTQEACFIPPVTGGPPPLTEYIDSLIENSPFLIRSHDLFEDEEIEMVVDRYPHLGEFDCQPDGLSFKFTSHLIPPVLCENDDALFKYRNLQQDRGIVRPFPASRKKEGLKTRLEQHQLRFAEFWNETVEADNMLAPLTPFIIARPVELLLRPEEEITDEKPRMPSERLLRDLVNVEDGLVQLMMRFCFASPHAPSLIEPEDAALSDRDEEVNQRLAAVLSNQDGGVYRRLAADFVHVRRTILDLYLNQMDRIEFV